MDLRVIVENVPYMLTGLQLTVILSVVSMVGSFAGGAVFAMLRLSPWWWLRWPAILYIDIVRTVPLIMVIFWAFFLIPVLTGHATTPVKAALFALVLFNTSYMAEVIRAGIQSIPKGQVEASRAIGLTYLQAMRHVVLPQALRHMSPALVSRFIALFMGTSLVYIIGVTEFFRAANNVNNRVYRSYEIYGFVALVYFVCCYALSLASTALERRFAVPNGGGQDTRAIALTAGGRARGTRAVTSLFGGATGADLRRPE
jgi:His/Glu/Gln/Arg/opine family amino acid ABC transporter permease subunit